MQKVRQSGVLNVCIVLIISMRLTYIVFVLLVRGNKNNDSQNKMLTLPKCIYMVSFIKSFICVLCFQLQVHKTTKL